LINKPSENSDVDIFSHQLSNKEFHKFIAMLQIRFRTNGILHQMNAFNQYIITFHLIYGEKIIRIQFVWTCKKATIAQILLSFDLAASQIAYIPNRDSKQSRMLFTDSFKFFLNTGKCIVFNFHLQRIKK